MRMSIHDTAVYDQPKLFPLDLRKDYQKQFHVLKKYVTAIKRKQRDILAQIVAQFQEQSLDSVVTKKKSTENAEEQNKAIQTPDILNDEDLNILDVIYDDEEEDDQESNLQPQLKTAQNFIKSEKLKQKENRHKVQPKIFQGWVFNQV